MWNRMQAKKKPFAGREFLVQVVIDKQFDIPLFHHHYFYERVCRFGFRGAEWMLVRLVPQREEVAGIHAIRVEPQWYATDGMACLPAVPPPEPFRKVVVSSFQRGVQYVDRVEALDPQAEIDQRCRDGEHACAFAPWTMERFGVGDRLVLVHEEADFPHYELRHAFFVVCQTPHDGLLILAEVECARTDVGGPVPNGCFFRTHHAETHVLPLWHRVVGNAIGFFQRRCVCVREWSVHERDGVLRRFDADEEYVNYYFHDPNDASDGSEENV